MKKKVSELLRHSKKVRQEQASFPAKDIDEPLLVESYEGGKGSPLRGPRISDMNASFNSDRAMKGFGLPVQIKMEDKDINFLEQGARVRSNQIHYDFFKQSFFDVPVNSFDPLIGSDKMENGNDFDIEQFSKELDEVANASVSRPTKINHLCNRKILEKKEERYHSVIKYKSLRPPFDANKDQIFFDKYMEAFEEAIKSQKTYKATDQETFEESELDQIIRDLVQDSIPKYDTHDGVNADHENKPTHINKSLICSGSFGSQNWLLELKKIYDPDGEEHENSGKLYLELAQFNFEGKRKPQGTTLLHNFEGKEAFNLFNGNFEALFNHIQFRDTLYYFSIDKNKESSFEEYDIKLNGFKITDESNLDETSGYSAKVKEIKISQNEINQHINNGKIMGAIIIKGHHNHFDPITEEMTFFFAIIYALDGESPQICYDIRHISNHEKTITVQRVKAPGTMKKKKKHFDNQIPVIIQLDALKVINQMTMIGKMNKKDKSQFLTEVDKKAKAHEKILKLQQIQASKNNLSQSLGSLYNKGKPQVQSNDNNRRLEMFAIGSLNENVYDKVHQFFFIDKYLDPIDVNEDRNGFLKQQDVGEIKEMLIQSLRLLCLTNSCNIVKFNSEKIVPECFEKVLCRGQIELIKRLFQKIQSQTVQSEIKVETKSVIEDDYAKYTDGSQSDDEALNTSNIQIRFQVQKSKQMQQMQKENMLQDYACASIIDNLNRRMTINVYHKGNANKQFVLHLPLTNLITTWKDQLDFNQEYLKQDQVQMYGYNKLFYKAFKQQVQKDSNSMAPKLIISKKFDNIARDMNNVYWLQNDVEDENSNLLKSSDPHYSVTQLRSRFQILSDNGQLDGLQNSISQNKERFQFIYSTVKEWNEDTGKNCYQVTEFKNYTDNKPRTYFKNSKIKAIENENKKLKEKGLQQKKVELVIEEDDEAIVPINKDFEYKAPFKTKGAENKFNLEDKFVILQNCIFVEDDREDIPVCIVGKGYKSVQFAIMRHDKIQAVASLRVTQEELAVNIDNQADFYQTYPQIVQLCASSDIREGHDQDNTIYMFQNYTVTLFFPKMYRFRMNEFQVKWIPNKDLLTKESDPFKISISLMKVRDVVFKKKKDEHIINKFYQMPLFEQKQILQDERSSFKGADRKTYEINGVQCYFQLKGGLTCFLNFRSLSLDEDLKKFKEVNYDLRLFLSSTKLINQQFISGVYAETQFKHQIEWDTTSDTVNSKIFKNSEAFSILREANINALNSMPKDFIGLMDCPQVNNEWYQLTQRHASEDAKAQIHLDVMSLLKDNFKRYFNPWEILDGYQMLNQIGLIQRGEDSIHDDFKSIIVPQNKAVKFVGGVVTGAAAGLGDVTSGMTNIAFGHGVQVLVNRDPTQIKKIFGHLNEQQDDRFYDYKFLKDVRTPVFCLSIIERALRNDPTTQRFSSLRKKGLVMDGKDTITSNMDLESVMQYPLLCNDTKMVDIYLRELYENNQYSVNKYSQMMRILPLILDKGTYYSEEFFNFFIDADNQFQNDDVERKEEQESEGDIIEDDVFKGEELPDFITFSQFFPAQMQDLIDSYTDQRVQIFTEDTSKNLKNLVVTSTLRQQFNLIQKDYKSAGSKYEVLASHVDYKPYILGKKINAISKAKSIGDIKDVKDVQMDKYVLSNMISRIMNLTKGKIDEQKSLRDIIDYQFKETKKFFYFNLLIYCFGYFFPLITQMKTTNQQTVMICNISCLVLQSYCMVYEAISIISDGYKIYFSSWWNFVDCLTIATYYLYFVYRFEYLDRNILPQLPDDFDEKNQKTLDFLKTEHEDYIRQFTPIIHCLLIVTAFLKLMYFLRCDPEFGQFVQLVLSCINDVKIFSFFFFTWVIIFGQLFQVVGSTFGDEDYPLLPGLSYYLQTYRNSIGDISPPSYDYWAKMHEHYGDNKKYSYPMCMIYMIWTLWFFNQFFNLIILLNFLIAIVSQSYDRVCSERMNYEYSHKAELNEETQRFFKVFRKPPNFDIMCIVSSHEDDINKDDQIMGLSFTIKQYMKQQVNSLRDDVNNRFDKTDQNYMAMFDKLQRYIDSQFVQTIEGSATIKKQITSIGEQIGKGVATDDEANENQMKMNDMVELMRQNAILLEKVSRQQVSESEVQQRIKEILKNQSQNHQKEQEALKQQLESTNQALNTVNAQLQQSLEDNESIKAELEQNKQQIAELSKNAKQEVKQLSEIASNQTQNYQELKEQVNLLQNDLTQEVNTVQNEMNTFQTKCVEDMSNVFDEKLSQLKEMIQKQDEEVDDDGE